MGRLPSKPDSIRIFEGTSENDIVDTIAEEAARTQFVIIDLEGTASLMVANAIGTSDRVVIPTQGGSMDAKGAAKMIKLIRNQERMTRRLSLEFRADQTSVRDIPSPGACGFGS